MTNLKKEPDFDQYEINNVFFVHISTICILVWQKMKHEE